MVVLTLVPHYIPGFRYGGPVRSVANMVAHLGGEMEFRIITADRDMHDSGPYSGIAIDEWSSVGGAEVYYASRRALSFRALAALIRETPHDLLYLNSYFHRVFTQRPLLARWLGLLPKRPVIVAPRGEFSEGAFALKRWKKAPYRTVTAAAGLYRDVIWHASTELEAEDIRRNLGSDIQVHIAPNLPAPIVEGVAGGDGAGRDRGDALRVVFLSRISPKKNLDFALRVLERVRVPVEFNIYGPVEDQAYWRRCQRLASGLPESVTVSYRGSVAHEVVGEVIAGHDLFFLPTRGENYGHVIAEAASAGTPLLLADTTPWRGLEAAGVGWDLPLDEIDSFARSIEHCASLSTAEYGAWRRRVREFARRQLAVGELVEATRRLFVSSLA